MHVCHAMQDSVTGHITDMFSFYHLPSTVVRHKTHKKLHSTYSFYNVSTKTPLKDLMFDALIAAKSVRWAEYGNVLYITWPSVCLSVQLSVCLFVCPSVCLFICLSVCL